MMQKVAQIYGGLKHSLIWAHLTLMNIDLSLVYKMPVLVDLPHYFLQSSMRKARHTYKKIAKCACLFQWEEGNKLLPFTSGSRLFPIKLNMCDPFP